MARGMGVVGGNGGLGVGNTDMPVRNGVHRLRVRGFRVRSTILFGIVGVRRALLAEQLVLILLVLGLVVSESPFLLGAIYSDIVSARCVDHLLLVSGIGCTWCLFAFAVVLLLFDSSFLGWRIGPVLLV